MIVGSGSVITDVMSLEKRMNDIPRLGLIEAGGYMLLTGLGVAFYLGMPLWAHFVTFRGLCRPALQNRPTTRFGLLDLMVLFALVAAAVTFGTKAAPLQGGPNWILIVSLNVFVALMWLKCIQFMQKNGIVENASRLLMQIFVYPSSIYALALFIFCSYLVIVGSIASLVPNYRDPVVRELPNHFLFLLASGAWLYLTRWSFFAILNRNPVQTAT